MSVEFKTLSLKCGVLQEVNENSLQKLNGYLERLNKFGGNSIQPVKLTFYVRDTKDNSDAQRSISTTGTFIFSN